MSVLIAGVGEPRNVSGNQAMLTICWIVSKNGVKKVQRVITCAYLPKSPVGDLIVYVSPRSTRKTDQAVE